MREPHKRADWPIIAAAIAVVVLTALGGYVCCYLAMTREVNEAGYQTTYRIYSHVWKARMFRPAAEVESWLVGHKVEAIGPPELVWLDDDTGGPLPRNPLPLAADFIAEATSRKFPHWEFYETFGMPTIEERGDELVLLYDCHDARVQLAINREKFEQGVVEVVEGKAY